MPTELERKDALIRKLGRIERGKDAQILDLQARLEMKQGQVDVLMAQMGTAEISQDMQNHITQVSIEGANRINQDMAGLLVAANQKVRVLKEILEENEIEYHGHLDNLGD